MNDIPAAAWVRTQAGPTIRMALRKAVNLSSPAISWSRAAKVSCMLSEKLITMMSGVITLRNMFKRKADPAERARAQRHREQRRPAATIMNDTRRKNSDRDHAAGDKAKAL